MELAELACVCRERAREVRRARGREWKEYHVSPCCGSENFLSAGRTQNTTSACRRVHKTIEKEETARHLFFYQMCRLEAIAIRSIFVNILGFWLLGSFGLRAGKLGPHQGIENLQRNMSCGIARARASSASQA